MLLTKKARSPCRRRATAIAATAVFSSVVGLGFAALAVDTGLMFGAKSELQSAADASALAGASGLLSGNAVVQNRVLEYARLNEIGGVPLSSSEVTMTIGNWEGVRRTFSPLNGSETVTPNAVRVVGTRNGVSLLFAKSLGMQTTNLARGATAILGSGVCAGVWGLDGIFGDGNVQTDSYDIGQGGYGGQNINPNGDLCSCTDITLNGDVDIYGDAMYGDGHDLITSGSAYNVWGVTGEHSCSITVPSFDIVDAAVHNDNGTIGLTDRNRDPFGGGQWDLVVTGNDNLTLTGGTYYFTSAVVDGRATLTIRGPTVIFLSGPAEFTGGGITNVSQVPGDLVIYATGSPLIFSGTSGFYGAVIAPTSDIQLVGTSDFYGILLGSTLDMDGTTNIHVEESLVFDLFGIQTVAPLLVQ